MIRKIIHIDEEKCNGCGACAKACHEGAIGMVNGKAELMRDDYCDSFGDCLPVCPTGAITFTEREATAYDKSAVAHAKARKLMRAVEGDGNGHDLPCGCPGTKPQVIERNTEEAKASYAAEVQQSQLTQWPVQIKLVPEQAPYFDGSHLLVAATCTAYAFGDFHNTFIKGKTVIVGCPKLDGVDYSEKLTAIIRDNDVKSVTCVRMEVPCCGGLETAVKNALQASGKFIPWNVVTITRDGQVLKD
jgi:Fe-S-cluster-containing hydrogenase component 2